MITTKCVNIQAHTVFNAICEYNFSALCDAAATLKIDNKSVLEIDPNMTDRRFLRCSYFYFGGNGGNARGDHVNYFKFANDFAYINCGIFNTCAIVTICRTDANSSDYVYTVDREDCIRVWGLDCANIGDGVEYFLGGLMHDDNSAWGYYNSIPRIKELPYYLYNGVSVAYLGLGSHKANVVFAKMKSIDDPTQYKYIIITVNIRPNLSDGAYSDNLYYGRYYNLKILDSNSVATTTYTGPINKYLTDVDKSVIEKFVYNGYYSDELYLFDGLCPDGLFSINGNTYLNIAYNLYMKIVN